MSDESIDLRALSRTTWRTAISGRVMSFATTIADQAVFDKYFGEMYVERLSAKIDRIFRNELLTGLVFTALMASLFVAQDTKNTEFQFLGYSFKNVGQYKEILLLLAAVLSPIATVLAGYRRYLVAVRAECLKKIAPDPTIRSFYQQLHVNDYFDAIIRDTSRTSPRGLTVFLSATLALFFVILGLGFLVASFSLQISVFYDVATHPASTKYVNTIVISLSLASILLSWVIGLMQLPLPELNPAYYQKLNELRASDQERYDRAMRAVITESERKGRLLYIAASLMAFMLAYAIISIFFYPRSLDNLGPFIGKALLGSVLVVFGANAATSKIRKACYRWLFRRYPGESEQRLSAFITIGRATTILRASAVITMSIAYSIFALGAQ